MELSISRAQWPRRLRRRSAATWLLWLWVRIPLVAWMFVCCECCVLSGRRLCDGLVTRPEESYWLMCRVWSRNLDNEALAHRELSCQKRSCLFHAQPWVAEYLFLPGSSPSAYSVWEALPVATLWRSGSFDHASPSITPNWRYFRDPVGSEGVKKLCLL
jgi:hypothetical protein